MMKKVALGFAVLVLVIAGGAYYLFSNLDSIIKTAVEKYGSEAAQAKVTLDKVTLNIQGGEAALGGLVVSNPKGFSTPQAFSLGQINVKLDTATVRQSPIVIKEIVISAPQVTYEHASGGSNLETIQKNAQAYAQAKGAGGTGSGGQPASGAKKDDEPKVIIEHLYVRDGKIAISHSALQGKTMSSALPTIHLTDIGKAKGGATPAEVADRVMGAISQAASRVAIQDLQKQIGDQVKGVIGNVGGATGGAAGGAADKLKGLLGK